MSAILGLNNLKGVAHPHYRKNPITPKGVQAPNAAGVLAPMAITGGTGPGGYLAPTDIKSIYGLSGTALSGAGQRVALFELDGFTPSDINFYKTTFGLGNAAVTFKGVDGVTNVPGADAAEVTLDIELVLAVAPGVSEIISYTGPNTALGVYNTYNQIAMDNTCTVVSSSWGLYESGSSGAFINAESQIFQRMAAQGQSIYAASGDFGAFDDGSTLSVDDPASQPYVTGVGGTTLMGSVAAPSETTWTGSGGGVSAVWPLPSYQSGVSGLASQTMRNVPDVSLNADPNTGYAIYLNGGWYAFGGTSAAAPLWAGMTALLNEQRAQTGTGSFGFANSSLYELAASTSGALAYNDITTGDNQFYTAVAGYDNATGWGSYKGIALINQESTVDPYRVSYALSNVYAFPNPWDARIHTNRLITFTNSPLLTNGATVKIFTLSGYWVKTLTASNGSARWQDLTNDAGERVASGLYYYLVDLGGEQAKGTIAIIK